MHVAVYARFSTDMQRDTSIEDEERLCFRCVWRGVKR